MQKKKRVAIGYEDFKRVIDGNFYYVDKSLFIRDIIEQGQIVNLITRPRRFGKTLNFSMLRYFFDVTEKDSAYMFDGLKISEYYDELKEYRNTHPVISLSMKGGKQPSFELALDSLCNEIRGQFSKYRHIAADERVEPRLREGFMTVYSSKGADLALFKESIKLLSECVEQYYGKRAIILIDEYDVPLENSYFRGFYDEMIGFIRSLFESALKTNASLEFAVITGCLRVSKESIFTGLNNLSVNSILNNRYAEYFGFEENEVKEMLEYFDAGEYFDITKEWYDGYQFGKTEVYNPWSVVNYVMRVLAESDKLPRAEWVNSSSNSIIRKLVETADEETKADIERLMNGGSIEAYLDETVTYADLDSKKTNMWNFLFFTGYLKTAGSRAVDETALYTLVIPNKEILHCYRKIIMNYFEKKRESVDRRALYTALLSGDAEGFARIITELLSAGISYHDRSESFYHGLISGLLANNPYYELRSNRESGDGRCDIMLYQQDKADKAIIMELKLCSGPEPVESACKRALKQINDRRYSAEAEHFGYKNIIKYGVAFKNKICGAICEQ